MQEYLAIQEAINKKTKKIKPQKITNKHQKNTINPMMQKKRQKTQPLINFKMTKTTNKITEKSKTKQKKNMQNIHKNKQRKDIIKIFEKYLSLMVFQIQVILLIS